MFFILPLTILLAVVMFKVSTTVLTTLLVTPLNDWIDIASATIFPSSLNLLEIVVIEIDSLTLLVIASILFASTIIWNTPLWNISWKNPSDFISIVSAILYILPRICKISGVNNWYTPFWNMLWNTPFGEMSNVSETFITIFIKREIESDIPTFSFTTLATSLTTPRND